MTADELTTETVYRIATDAKAAQAGLKLVRDGRFSELRRTWAPSGRSA
jgi:hypothetical protein